VKYVIEMDVRKKGGGAVSARNDRGKSRGKIDEKTGMTGEA